MAVLQLSIILYYDTLKILKSGLDRGPIIINRANGDKIYHLPFDQQYDRCIINEPGEFYASTVAEAEKAGFRRAMRWRGN